jgi:hypothetical protein
MDGSRDRQAEKTSESAKALGTHRLLPSNRIRSVRLHHSPSTFSSGWNSSVSDMHGIYTQVPTLKKSTYTSRHISNA